MVSCGILERVCSHRLQSTHVSVIKERMPDSQGHPLPVQQEQESELQGESLRMKRPGSMPLLLDSPKWNIVEI